MLNLLRLISLKCILNKGTSKLDKVSTLLIKQVLYKSKLKGVQHDKYNKRHN